MDSAWLKTTLRSKRITQRTLGDVIGLSQDKVNKALAHVRQFSPIEAIKIADFLEGHQVDRAETLRAILGKDAAFLEGKVAERGGSTYQPLTAPKPVPIIGIVGPLGTIVCFDGSKSPDLADPVTLTSPVESLVAIRVQGDALYPAYRAGDILYYDNHGRVDTNALNKEVVIELQDGNKLLRTLKRSTIEGRHTLESFNSPVMEHVSLKSASRILWTKKV